MEVPKIKTIDAINTPVLNVNQNGPSRERL